MILRLLKSKKALTTAQLNKAWKAEGRGGSADTSLCNLVAAKTLKREPVTQGQGSNYSLA